MGLVVNQVVICECFARDGLQHETMSLSTADKIAAIDAFSAAGFQRIEATSYSNPSRVPMFHDASLVLAGIKRRPGVAYKATCPNPKAVERARKDKAAGYGAEELSLLVSATEAHSERNLGTSRDRQWANVGEMAEAARGQFRIVGVVSVAFGCPFEGPVDAERVIADVARLAALGAELVTIGDTIGAATPTAVKSLFHKLFREVPEIIPVAHFHDTRGSGIANCMAALEAGVRYFDSAMGGVGGHPAKIQYGEGQTGNVATEDLVNLLAAEGIETGLDMDAILQASRLCERTLQRELLSRVARSGFNGASTKMSTNGK